MRRRAVAGAAGPPLGRYGTGILALLALLSAGCSKDAGPDGVWFADEAGSRGISFRHVSGAEGRFWTPEIMGGGVALADVDNDGDLDAYFVQSGFPNGQPSRPETSSISTTVGVASSLPGIRGTPRIGAMAWGWRPATTTTTAMWISM